MPVISLQLSQKPQHYESNLIETTIDNRISFPDQFLQLKSNYRVAENLCIAKKKFQIFAWQQILNLVGLIIYISKSLSKFLCQFTIVIATERKGKKKTMTTTFGFLGSSLFVISPKNFTLCGLAASTFSCREESLGPPESVSNQESPLQLECSRYNSSVDETQLS
jgi:hypothetical protein